MLDDLFQSGSAKARFPKVFDGGPPEGVLINLAGGVTGGDCFQQTVRMDKGAHAIITTQAAEKIYKASAGSAAGRIINTLTVEPDAFAEWLPQETIFFDAARLQRRFEIELGPTAQLLACEAMVFGRTAMGETVRTGYLSDNWRVTMGDRLVFADGLRFDKLIQDRLDRPAVAAGSRALATVLYAGPNCESLIGLAKQAVEAFINEGQRAAASRIGDLIVARFIATNGVLLKSMLIPYIETIRAATGSSGGLPKLWRC